MILDRSSCSEISFRQLPLCCMPIFARYPQKGWPSVVEALTMNIAYLAFSSTLIVALIHFDDAPRAS